MKKIDLHIHTVKTNNDRDFVFSLKRLTEYVNEMQIDAIAITNHNMFDKTQYFAIRDALENVKVFPGIEVSLGINGGHMLVICEPVDVEDFESKCKFVESKINTFEDKLTYDEFISIFSNIEKYLLIPHYEKDPHVDKNIIDNLGKQVKCGEVSSPKKFLYCKKNHGLTPVIFSDWRPVEGSCLPVKQTYLDIGSITLNSIKKCLSDMSKVQLTDKEGQHLFQALPNLRLSTGLSVILGGRSSGKTFTLNCINKEHDNVKYIKQFSLLERDPGKAEQDFNRPIENRNSIFLESYYKPFAQAVSDIIDIDKESEEDNIDKYIKSLIKYASETERADAFSKCKMFYESEYAMDNLKILEDLIEAVETILDARKYKEIIENNIERSSLIDLHKELINKHIEEDIKQRKKSWVNEVLINIKAGLQARTSATRIADVDFYRVQINRKKLEKFETLSEQIKRDSIIFETELEGFKIQISKRKYINATELKNQSGKKAAFSKAYEKYDSSAYEYLKELKEIEVIQDKDYYQFFAKTECKILNQVGLEVSGGERAEFNLLREINDALQFDMLLIDEPESSFDNLFLKDKVNHLIKQIAAEMPVVLVTHNNTVGASIKPDYIVHTRRVIEAGKPIFEVYTGFPGDHDLISGDGKRIPNIKVTMDCLEAGRDAYEERRIDYEMLED